MLPKLLLLMDPNPLRLTVNKKATTMVSLCTAFQPSVLFSTEPVF